MKIQLTLCVKYKSKHHHDDKHDILLSRRQAAISHSLTHSFNHSLTHSRICQVDGRGVSITFNKYII